MNKYTLSYTLYDTSRKSLKKPKHMKMSFESDTDLLGALDEAGCRVWDGLKDVYGPLHSVSVIMRSITHDNAQEFYQLIVEQEASNE